MQSTPPQLISPRSILIPSFHLRLCLPSALFPLGFPTKTLHTTYTHIYRDQKSRSSGLSFLFLILVVSGSNLYPETNYFNIIFVDFIISSGKCKYIKPILIPVTTISFHVLPNSLFIKNRIITGGYSNIIV
jgi:hypothetical protein